MNFVPYYRDPADEIGESHIGLDGGNGNTASGRPDEEVASTVVNEGDGSEGEKEGVVQVEHGQRGGNEAVERGGKQ